MSIAVYYRESFEGNFRKFSKFENENEGNIFESFGIPTADPSKMNSHTLWFTLNPIGQNIFKVFVF